MHDENRFAAGPSHCFVRLILLLAQTHGTETAIVLKRHVKGTISDVLLDGLEVRIDVVPLVDTVTAHVLDACRDYSAHSRDVIRSCSCDVEVMS
jgi:hypothetical protein